MEEAKNENDCNNVQKKPRGRPRNVKAPRTEAQRANDLKCREKILGYAR